MSDQFKVARVKKSDGTSEDLRFPIDTPDDAMAEAVTQYMSKSETPSGDTPLGLRMKLSFAENQAAQQKTLENLYGKENVQTDLKGKLMYREHSAEQFRPVNPVGFDLGDLADYTGDAPEMVLGTLGAIGGTVLGGGLPGAVVGAAAGGAVGRGIKSTIGSAMGVPQPSTGTDILGGAAMGALGELGGRAAVAVGGKVLAPFARKVMPEAQAAIAWMDKYLPRPTDLQSKAMHAVGMDSPRLLPAEATESRMLDFAHNIAENSLLGAGAIAGYKADRNKALNAFADDFAAQFGANLDAQTLGTTVKNVIEGSYNATHLPAQAMLNAVEQKTGNLKVNITALKKTAGDALKKSEPLNGFDAEMAGDNIRAMVAGFEDEIPLSAASELRSRLISKGNEFSIANKKAKAIGYAKSATSMVDDAISKTLQDQAPEQYVEWRVANALYKNSEKTFNGKFARRLIQMADPDKGGNPEGIVQAIFRPGKPSLVEAAQRALDAPTMRKVNSYMLNSTFQKAIDPATGVMSGAALEAATLGPKGLGEKTMRMALGDNFDVFQGFVNTLKSVEAKQASGTGSMFIQLAQAGAIIQGVQGMAGVGTGASQGLNSTAGAVLLAPYALSKVMTTRLGMRLLTKGITLPAGSPEAAGIAGRLIALQSQLADVDMLSDAEAETKTTIPELPTKRFNMVGGQPQ